MNYTVTWRDEAQADLVEIWLGSRIRWQLNEATKELERVLRESPYDFGESRAGNLRVGDSGPLLVWCRTLEADRRVEVLGVRLIP